MTITDRPPVRRPAPIRNGPGDPAARALTTTLYICGLVGILAGATGDHAITYAAFAIAIAAVAAAHAYRLAVK